MRVEEVNLPDANTGRPCDGTFHMARNVKYEAEIVWKVTGERIHVIWENPAYDRGDYGRGGVWDILAAVQKFEENPKNGVDTKYFKLKLREVENDR